MHVIFSVSVFNSITKLQLVFFINRNQYADILFHQLFDHFVQK